jgi:hypothetical protein
MIKSLDALLGELNIRGITLRCDGDRLMVADPQRAITLELSAALRLHKAALLSRLASPTSRDQLPLATMTDEAPGADVGRAARGLASSPGESDRLVTPPTPASFGERVQAITAAQAEATQIRLAAEARLSDIFEQGEHADDLHASAWARLYALTAIVAGMPCYDERGGHDLGAAGWRSWLAQAKAAPA